MLSMSLMFAALALTNCSNADVEEAVNIDTNKGVTITVNADSRADINGNKVVWQEGDAISFGSVAEGSTYTTARLYDYVYVSDNKFYNEKGNAFEGKHQFYALWPVVHKSTSTNYAEVYTTNETTNTPQTSQKYLNVGKSLVQNGNNSAAHVLAESPMYWMSEGAVDFSTINVQLHHTTTLMKFSVVNNHTANITVNSLKLVTPETVKISGTYYVNLADGSLVGSGDQYVYNETTVSVENATAIKTGESMDVYMPVAPFALASGNAVTIVVTTEEGYVCTIEKTMTAAKEFKAGALNTATVNFEKPILAKDYTITELLAAVTADPEIVLAGSTAYGYVLGVADGTANQSFGTVILSDNTGEKNSSIVFYGSNGINKKEGLSVGDYVSVSLNTSTVSAYKGLVQINGNVADDAKIEIDGDASALVYKEITIADYLANKDSYNGVYMKFKGIKPAAESVGKNATGTLTFTDGTNNLTVANRSSWAVGAANTICDFTGDLYAIGSTAADAASGVIASGEAQVVPLKESDMSDFFDPAVLAKTKVSLAANGGAAGSAPEAQVVEVTLRDGYALGTATGYPDWITVTATDSNSILVAVKEYTATDAPRTATITLPVTSGGVEVLTKTITVEQSQVGAATAQTVEFLPADISLVNKEHVGSKDGVSYLGVQGSSSSALVAPSADHWRVYKSTDFTVSVESGSIISVIVEYTGASKYTTALVPNSGSYSLDETNAVGTWTGEASSVNFKASNSQVRIKKLTVIYK